MHLTSVTARGFRNLNGRIPLSSPLAVIIGENNTGKSNVIDALRLVLEPAAGPRAKRWVGLDDFAHDGHGNRVVDSLDLEVQLAGLTDRESGRLATCVAPSLGDGCARLRLSATLRSDDKIDVDWYGGDSLRPEVERWAREAVTYTYLHPLRDAANDLRPGRDNRLVALLDSLAPTGHADRSTVESIATDANTALAAVGAISDARSAIQDRLRSMTGAGAFTQQSDLRFADAKFQRVVATLRAMAGQLTPLELHENGLGLNNLLYMAVLLAGLSHRTEMGLHVLLVEEPEAHLHPQLQDLLVQHLEDQAGESTQVVVTTHSPNLASAARVERATILSASQPTDGIPARSPSAFGLSQDDLDHLHRFLDVTKASLLFARGVILVEGVAELLLLPEMAKRLGVPLAPAGVTVVNIGGVAFGPFMRLFGPGALPRRCAVVTDTDPETQDEDDPTGPIPEGEEAAAVRDQLPTRIQNLLEDQNANVRVFRSTETLEWDLVVAGNWDVMVDALAKIKPRAAARLRRMHSESSPEDRADAFLSSVAGVKGSFAQWLASLVSDPAHDFVPPAYLQEAIRWSTGDTRD